MKNDNRFRFLWLCHAGVKLTPEYKFHPTRKWRFDYAHIEQKIAIELEGGVFTGGRHTRGMGYVNDCEKYNEAAFLGWTVLRLTCKQINSEYIKLVSDFIKSKMEK